MISARCRTLMRSANSPLGASGGSRNTVLYWMFRDLRADENWALLYAQQLALQRNSNLAVLYVLVPFYERFTFRHYHFLLNSLKELDEDLRCKNIPLFILEAESSKVSEAVAGAMRNLNADVLICDQAPTRQPTAWQRQLVETLSTGPNQSAPADVFQIDAHNVVPVWTVSSKLEWAARTIRPKIHIAMNKFVDNFPDLASMAASNMSQSLGSKFEANVANQITTTNNWQMIFKESIALKLADKTAGPVDEYFPPGSKAAKARLLQFLSADGIGKQSTRRNDPNYPAVASGISPYLNFGLISAQWIVKQVHDFDKATKGKFHKDCETYLEELLVRRELSDNFCFYNPNYDSVEGAPEWAQITLREHQSDRRDHVYTYEQFEDCRTHDRIWNASMMQLRREGKMHGFLRMYWAKKILEWTATPDDALDFAIRMNDRWALDGNDNPNGFVGIMWSICGVHDQGWAERAVYGKIRYMNESGCKRKFDVDKFIARYPVDVPKRSDDSDAAARKRSVSSLTAAHLAIEQNQGRDKKKARGVVF